MYRALVGKKGEEEAGKALKQAGYRVVESNYRCRHGEIDIVAWDGEVLAFVEVKTRASDRFGAPSSGVDSRKQRHIIAASEYYLQDKAISETLVRFDVVSIEMKDGRYSCEIIKDAFSDIS